MPYIINPELVDMPKNSRHNHLKIDAYLKDQYNKGKYTLEEHDDFKVYIRK